MARWAFVAVCWLLLQSTTAIKVNVEDPEVMKDAARIAAKKLMSYYHGNEPGQEPGLLPKPYYWWQAGAMFMTMLDYWKFTGDTTYNNLTKQALLAQTGLDDDYMPREQRGQLGNDDQAFWAMAAMNAVEYNFPDSTDPKDPSWLSLVQAVFNTQVARWNTDTCGGGLYWQIYESNKGYFLKNTISNGCFFQIAARLARYTGDPIYSAWAVKSWDWMKAVNLIDNNWSIYDLVDSTVPNCTKQDRKQWTYNAGTLMVGAATMYNITGSDLWRNRTQGLVDTTTFAFFPNGIMKEICEELSVCNPDQKSFKAYLSAWMARTTQLAPFTYKKIMPFLKSSAIAAGKQCSGGADGTTCGVKWYMNETWDGSDGVGQQMNAMEVFLSTTIAQQKIPVTNVTGGTSKSDPAAGTQRNDGDISNPFLVPVHHKDKVGAGIVTAILCAMVIFGCYFLMSSSFESGETGPKIKDKRVSAFALPMHNRRLKKGKGKETEKVTQPEVLDLGSGRRGDSAILQPTEETPTNLAPIYKGGTVPT